MRHASFAILLVSLFGTGLAQAAPVTTVNATPALQHTQATPHAAQHHKRTAHAKKAQGQKAHGKKHHNRTRHHKTH